MRSHIDIGEVEASTKIRAKYLRALENEEWDLLPGPVYIKSFLRTYGNYLGLDSRMLIDEFKHAYERPSDHEIRPPGSLGRERERRARGGGPRIPPWVSIVAVAAVVVGILYAVGSANQGGSNTPPTTRTSATTKDHTVTHPHRSTVPPKPPPPKKVTLRMTPTGAVYVCLVDAAGIKLIFEKTYTQGQTVPVEKGKKLLLTLGNNLMNVKVNGRSVPIAPSASPIRLLITPKHTTHIPLTQQPTCP